MPVLVSAMTGTLGWSALTASVVLSAATALLSRLSQFFARGQLGKRHPRLLSVLKPLVLLLTAFLLLAADPTLSSTLVASPLFSPLGLVWLLADAVADPLSRRLGLTIGMVDESELRLQLESLRRKLEAGGGALSAADTLVLDAARKAGLDPVLIGTVEMHAILARMRQPDQRRSSFTPEEARQWARFRDAVEVMKQADRPGWQKAEQLRNDVGITTIEPWIRRRVEQRSGGRAIEDLVQASKEGLIEYAIPKFDPEIASWTTLATQRIDQTVQRALHQEEYPTAFRMPEHQHQALSQVRRARRELVLRYGGRYQPEPDELLEVLQERHPKSGWTREKLDKVTGVEQRAVRPLEMDRPLHEDEEDSTLHGVVADPEADIEAQAVKESDRRRLLRHLAGMPRKPACVLRLRHLSIEEWTLYEIGEAVGISRERIRQVETVAKGMLRHRLERERVDREESQEALAAKAERLAVRAQELEDTVALAEQVFAAEPDRALAARTRSLMQELGRIPSVEEIMAALGDRAGDYEPQQIQQSIELRRVLQTIPQAEAFDPSYTAAQALEALGTLRYVDIDFIERVIALRRFWHAQKVASHLPGAREWRRKRAQVRGLPRLLGFGTREPALQKYEEPFRELLALRSRYYQSPAEGPEWAELAHEFRTRAGALVRTLQDDPELQLQVVRGGEGIDVSSGAWLFYEEGRTRTLAVLSHMFRDKDGQELALIHLDTVVNANRVRLVRDTSRYRKLVTKSVKKAAEPVVSEEEGERSRAPLKRRLEAVEPFALEVEPSLEAGLTRAEASGAPPDAALAARARFTSVAQRVVGSLKSELKASMDATAQLDQLVGEAQRPLIDAGVAPAVADLRGTLDRQAARLNEIVGARSTERIPQAMAPEVLAFMRALEWHLRQPLRTMAQQRRGFASPDAREVRNVLDEVYSDLAMLHDWCIGLEAGLRNWPRTRALPIRQSEQGSAVFDLEALAKAVQPVTVRPRRARRAPAPPADTEGIAPELEELELVAAPAEDARSSEERAILLGVCHRLAERPKADLRVAAEAIHQLERPLGASDPAVLRRRAGTIREGYADMARTLERLRTWFATPSEWQVPDEVADATGVFMEALWLELEPRLQAVAAQRAAFDEPQPGTSLATAHGIINRLEELAERLARVQVGLRYRSTEIPLPMTREAEGRLSLDLDALARGERAPAKPALLVTEETLEAFRQRAQLLGPGAGPADRAAPAARELEPIAPSVTREQLEHLRTRIRLAREEWGKSWDEIGQAGPTPVSGLTVASFMGDPSHRLQREVYRRLLEAVRAIEGTPKPGVRFVWGLRGRAMVHPDDAATLRVRFEPLLTTWRLDAQTIAPHTDETAPLSEMTIDQFLSDPSHRLYLDTYVKLARACDRLEQRAADGQLEPRGPGEQWTPSARGALGPLVATEELQPLREQLNTLHEFGYGWSEIAEFTSTPLNAARVERIATDATYQVPRDVYDDLKAVADVLEDDLLERPEPLVRMVWPERGRPVVAPEETRVLCRELKDVAEQGATWEQLSAASDPTKPISAVRISQLATDPEARLYLDTYRKLRKAVVAIKQDIAAGRIKPRGPEDQDALRQRLQILHWGYGRSWSDIGQAADEPVGGGVIAAFVDDPTRQLRQETYGQLVTAVERSEAALTGPHLPPVRLSWRERGRPTVHPEDEAPLRERLRALHAAGWSWEEISAASDPHEPVGAVRMSQFARDDEVNFSFEVFQKAWLAAHALEQTPLPVREEALAEGRITKPTPAAPTPPPAPPVSAEQHLHVKPADPAVVQRELRTLLRAGRDEPLIARMAKTDVASVKKIAEGARVRKEVVQEVHRVTQELKARATSLQTRLKEAVRAGHLRTVARKAGVAQDVLETMVVSRWSPAPAIERRVEKALDEVERSKKPTKPRGPVKAFLEGQDAVPSGLRQAVLQGVVHALTMPVLVSAMTGTLGWSALTASVVLSAATALLSRLSQFFARGQLGKRHPVLRRFAEPLLLVMTALSLLGLDPNLLSTLQSSPLLTPIGALYSLAGLIAAPLNHRVQRSLGMVEQEQPRRRASLQGMEATARAAASQGWDIAETLWTSITSGQPVPEAARAKLAEVQAMLPALTEAEQSLPAGRSQPAAKRIAELREQLKQEQANTIRVSVLTNGAENLEMRSQLEKFAALQLEVAQQHLRSRRDVEALAAVVAAHNALLELSGWSSQVTGLGRVTLRQQRFATQGEPEHEVVAREPREVPYDDTPSAFRSQLHILENQVQDLREVLRHIKALGDLESALLLGTVPADVAAQLTQLQQEVAWTRRGHVDGKVDARKELGEAVQALTGAPKPLEAIQHMRSAKQALQTQRLPELMQTHQGVRARVMKLHHQMRRERAWVVALTAVMVQRVDGLEEQSRWFSQIAGLLSTSPDQDDPASGQYPPNGFAYETLTPLLDAVHGRVVAARAALDQEQAAREELQRLRRALASTRLAQSGLAQIVDDLNQMAKWLGSGLYRDWRTAVGEVARALAEPQTNLQPADLQPLHRWLADRSVRLSAPRMISAGESAAARRISEVLPILEWMRLAAEEALTDPKDRALLQGLRGWLLQIILDLKQVDVAARDRALAAVYPRGQRPASIQVAIDDLDRRVREAEQVPLGASELHSTIDAIRDQLLPLQVPSNALVPSGDHLSSPPGGPLTRPFKLVHELGHLVNGLLVGAKVSRLHRVSDASGRFVRYRVSISGMAPTPSWGTREHLRHLFVASGGAMASLAAAAVVPLIAGVLAYRMGIETLGQFALEHMFLSEGLAILGVAWMLGNYAMAYWIWDEDGRESDWNRIRHSRAYFTSGETARTTLWPENDRFFSPGQEPDDQGLLKQLQESRDALHAVEQRAEAVFVQGLRDWLLQTYPDLRNPQQHTLNARARQLRMAQKTLAGYIGRSRTDQAWKRFGLARMRQIANRFDLSLEDLMGGARGLLSELQEIERGRHPGQHRWVTALNSLRAATIERYGQAHWDRMLEALATRLDPGKVTYVNGLTDESVSLSAVNRVTEALEEVLGAKQPNEAPAAPEEAIPVVEEPAAAWSPSQVFREAVEQWTRLQQRLERHLAILERARQSQEPEVLEIRRSALGRIAGLASGSFSALSRELRMARWALGLSQAELAQQAGITLEELQSLEDNGGWSERLGQPLPELGARLQALTRAFTARLARMTSSQPPARQGGKPSPRAPLNKAAASIEAAFLILLGLIVIGGVAVALMTSYVALRWRLVDAATVLFRWIPKANVHQHLSGSVTPELALELYWNDRSARRTFLKRLTGEQGVESLSDDAVDRRFIDAMGRRGDPRAIARMRALIAYEPSAGTGDHTDYERHLDPARILFESERGLNALRRIAYEVAMANDRDGVRYLELRTLGVRDGIDFADEEMDRTLTAIVEGLTRAERETKGRLRTGLLMGLVQGLTPGQAMAQVAALVRIRNRWRATHPAGDADKLLGIDSLRTDPSFDPQRHLEAFKLAKREGLHVGIHLAEAWLPGELEATLRHARALLDEGIVERAANLNALLVDPESLPEVERATIRALQEEIIALLVAQGIPVEVNPTSNERLSQSLRDVEGWRFRDVTELIDRGVHVVVGQDNSETFVTGGLSREIARLGLTGIMGRPLSLRTIWRLARRSREASFLTPKPQVAREVRVDTPVWLFLGPPGSGKTYTSGEIANRLGVPHISLGDLFREAAASGQALKIDTALDLLDAMLAERSHTLRAGLVLDATPLERGEIETIHRILERHGFTVRRIVHLTATEEQSIAAMSARKRPGTWIADQTAPTEDDPTARHRRYEIYASVVAPDVDALKAQGRQIVEVASEPKDTLTSRAQFAVEEATRQQFAAVLEALRTAAYGPEGTLVLPTAADAWDYYWAITDLIATRVIGPQFSDEERAALPMFREALWHLVTNAVIHGNGQQPMRVVRIGWRITADRITVTIDDEGQEPFGTSREVVFDGNVQISGNVKHFQVTQEAMRRLGGDLIAEDLTTNGDTRGHRVLLSASRARVRLAASQADPAAETLLWRIPGQFAALERMATDLMRARGGEPNAAFRLMSIGSSTGEEPATAVSVLQGVLERCPECRAVRPRTVAVELNPERAELTRQQLRKPSFYSEQVNTKIVIENALPVALRAFIAQRAPALAKRLQETGDVDQWTQEAREDLATLLSDAVNEGVRAAQTTQEIVVTERSALSDEVGEELRQSDVVFVNNVALYWPEDEIRAFAGRLHGLPEGAYVMTTKDDGDPLHKLLLADTEHFELAQEGKRWALLRRQPVHFAKPPTGERSAVEQSAGKQPLSPRALVEQLRQVMAKATDKEVIFTALPVGAHSSLVRLDAAPKNGLSGAFGTHRALTGGHPPAWIPGNIEEPVDQATGRVSFYAPDPREYLWAKGIAPRGTEDEVLAQATSQLSEDYIRLARAFVAGGMHPDKPLLDLEPVRRVFRARGFSQLPAPLTLGALAQLPLQEELESSVPGTPVAGTGGTGIDKTPGAAGPRGGSEPEQNLATVSEEEIHKAYQDSLKFGQWVSVDITKDAEYYFGSAISETERVRRLLKELTLDLPADAAEHLKQHLARSDLAEGLRQAYLTLQAAIGASPRRAELRGARYVISFSDDPRFQDARILAHAGRQSDK
ncbi:MAG: nucleoside monophosphate kinase, partial [Candidatus Omnitrophica bacterium]|nr:nucleoside monophosphate kinase [Candidatus Omnitrophota bacterium]